MKADHIVVPETCCGTCNSFVQHYMRKENGGFLPLWCGHCGLGKNGKQEKNQACPAYRESKPTKGMGETQGLYRINWKWD